MKFKSVESLLPFDEWNIDINKKSLLTKYIIISIFAIVGILMYCVCFLLPVIERLRDGDEESSDNDDDDPPTKPKAPRPSGLGRLNVIHGIDNSL